MADYFEACLRGRKELPAKEVSNWILGEVSRIMNANNIDMNELRERVSPEQLCELILRSRGATDIVGVINVATAKSVLQEMFQTGKTALDIIAQQGLSQISDAKEIEDTVIEVINSNAKPVADYRAGKEQALKFLVGQVMKVTRGRANPKLVNELLKEKLAEASSGGEEE
jgi:aspartyl-tRNA(Asn)/glutamyl-tRNA(Gln) amidotransferase subunit B